MEYTGYLGEADVNVQMCSVLTSFYCKPGIDRLTEETGFDIEMHLIIGYAWATQGKRLFIWDQCNFKFAMKTAVPNQVPWFLTFHLSWWAFEKPLSNFQWQMLQHAFFLFVPFSHPAFAMVCSPTAQFLNITLPGWRHSTSRKMTHLFCDTYFWDYYTEVSDVPLHVAVMLKDAPCQTSLTFLLGRSPKWVTLLLKQGTCLFSSPLEGTHNRHHTEWAEK